MSDLNNIMREQGGKVYYTPIEVYDVLIDTNFATIPYDRT